MSQVLRWLNCIEMLRNPLGSRMSSGLGAHEARLPTLSDRKIGQVSTYLGEVRIPFGVTCETQRAMPETSAGGRGRTVLTTRSRLLSINEARSKHENLDGTMPVEHRKDTRETLHTRKHREHRY